MLNASEREYTIRDSTLAIPASTLASAGTENREG